MFDERLKLKLKDSGDGGNGCILPSECVFLVCVLPLQAIEADTIAIFFSTRIDPRRTYFWEDELDG